MIQTVLIVDDDAVMGRATYRIVKRWLDGSPADPAVDRAVHFVHGDGSEVLKLLDESPAMAGGEILLLTDGNMPGMDGAALIEELQKRLGPRLTPILMSGNAHEFEADAQRLGFILLGKPVESDTLKPYVYKFLNLPELPRT